MTTFDNQKLARDVANKALRDGLKAGEEVEGGVAPAVPFVQSETSSIPLPPGDPEEDDDEDEEGDGEGTEEGENLKAPRARKPAKKAAAKKVAKRR